MSIYAIEVAKPARKQLAKLSQAVQERLAAQIDSLSINPRPRGCKKLSGAEPFYRIRVGEYRVVYEIKDQILVIHVVRIEHRRQVYR